MDIYEKLYQDTQWVKDNGLEGVELASLPEAISFLWDSEKSLHVFNLMMSTVYKMTDQLGWNIPTHFKESNDAAQQFFVLWNNPAYLRLLGANIQSLTPHIENIGLSETLRVLKFTRSFVAFVFDGQVTSKQAYWIPDDTRIEIREGGTKDGTLLETIDRNSLAYYLTHYYQPWKQSLAILEAYLKNNTENKRES